jgi:hypothetical protein
MGAPPESKAPLSTSSAHNGVSGGGRSGGVCTSDSARCAPVPSCPVPLRSGGVFVIVSVALTRGTKSASKANLNHL